MKSILLIAVIFLPSVFAIAQPANLDFENWYTDGAGKQRLTGWEHFSAWPNTNNSGSMLGTWRDSNMQHGNYALKMSRWYSYTNDWVRQKASIGFSPATVTGYYEYIDDSLVGPFAHDTAQVQVFLTKWNTSLNRNDTVGTGYADLPASVYYTPFNCNIIYTATTTPDSITLHILPTKWAYHSGICATSGTCSYLTIDNLSLGATNSIQYVSTSGMQVFPNPFDRSLTICAGTAAGQIAPAEIRISNVLGQVIYSTTMTGSEEHINTEKLDKGPYVLEVIRPGHRDRSVIVK